MRDTNYVAEIKITSLASHDTWSILEQKAPDLDSKDLEVHVSSDTGIFQNFVCMTYKMGLLFLNQ